MIIPLAQKTLHREYSAIWKTFLIVSTLTISFIVGLTCWAVSQHRALFALQFMDQPEESKSCYQRAVEKADDHFISFNVFSQRTGVKRRVCAPVESLLSAIKIEWGLRQYPLCTFRLQEIAMQKPNPDHTFQFWEYEALAYLPSLDSKVLKEVRTTMSKYSRVELIARVRGYHAPNETPLERRKHIHESAQVLIDMNILPRYKSTSEGPLLTIEDNDLLPSDAKTVLKWEKAHGPNRHEIGIFGQSITVVEIPER